MSAIDKCNAMKRLEQLGWKSKDENSYEMIPPKELFENSPKSFHVYDAEVLQELLSTKFSDRTE